MKKLLATIVSWGAPGLFFAALLDGAGLTIPGGVDVLVVYLAANRPNEILFLAALAVLGSTIGNTILFSIARKGGELFLDKRSGSRASRKFRQWFEQYGLLTVFISALVPLPVMPMKIFVFCSGALGIPLRRFLPVFLAGRIPRYIALAYLGSLMGNDALTYLRAHVWHLTLFAAVLFVVLWLMIRFVDEKRAREERMLSS
jgi:uncharacterized membrane protein YdjX (TVP38/TMEM64 family)